MSKGIEVMERTRMRLRTDGRHADRYIPWTYWSEDKNDHQLSASICDKKLPSTVS